MRTIQAGRKLKQVAFVAAYAVQQKQQRRASPGRRWNARRLGEMDQGQWLDSQCLIFDTSYTKGHEILRQCVIIREIRVLRIKRESFDFAQDMLRECSE